MSNSFNVDWVRRYDLPFRSTEGLTNPLNENKPVKISRDGQELPSPLGLQLCNMFDQEADAAGVPKPAPPSEPPFFPLLDVEFAIILEHAQCSPKLQPAVWTLSDQSGVTVWPCKHFLLQGTFLKTRQ